MDVREIAVGVLLAYGCIFFTRGCFLALENTVMPKSSYFLSNCAISSFAIQDALLGFLIISGAVFLNALNKEQKDQEESSLVQE